MLPVKSELNMQFPLHVFYVCVYALWLILKTKVPFMIHLITNLSQNQIHLLWLWLLLFNTSLNSSLIMPCFPVKVNKPVYDFKLTLSGERFNNNIETEVYRVYRLLNRWQTIFCCICKYIELVQETNSIFWSTAVHVDEGRKIVISKDDLEGMYHFYNFSPFAYTPGILHHN